MEQAKVPLMRVVQAHSDRSFETGEASGGPVLYPGIAAVASDGYFWAYANQSDIVESLEAPAHYR